MSFIIQADDSLSKINRKALAEIAEHTDTVAQVIVWLSKDGYSLQTKIGRYETSLACKPGDTVAYYPEIKRLAVPAK